MNPKLARQIARLERMTPRERTVLTICLCAVTWFVFTAFFIAPAERELATYGELAGTQQEALAAATLELEGLRSGSVPPGDPDLREQLAQLDKDNLSADASLRASQQYLVPSETMGALLHDLLRRDKRLDLLSLETLTVAPILDTSKETSAPVAEVAEAVEPLAAAAVLAQRSASPAVQTAMFRHGVRLAIRGNFLSVLEYLREVEKLPWQMYWGSFVMESKQSTEPGKNELPTYSLSIYTLSLDESWLKL